MRLARQLILAVVLLILPLALALPVAADSDGGDSMTQVGAANGTVKTWTIPAGQCPTLPAGLSITGSGSDNDTVANKTLPDGSQWMTDNDVVQGTAQGSDGTRYVFYYGNYATYQTPVNSPTGSAKMYDVFLLQSNPPATKGYVIFSGFKYLWNYTAPAGPFDVFPLPNLQTPMDFGHPVDANFAAVCDPL